MKFDHRYIYVVYVIVFVIIAFLLNNTYNLSGDSKETFSFIANVSELLGLFIALTEIFILGSITKRISSNVKSFYAYSNISNINFYLSQTKEDLISHKYGKAVLRLESIKEIYQESVSDIELSDSSSIHRENYDKLNSMITRLTISESIFSLKIADSDIAEYIGFLTGFNETITALKIIYKKSII